MYICTIIVLSCLYLVNFFYFFSENDISSYVWFPCRFTLINSKFGVSRKYICLFVHLYQNHPFSFIIFLVKYEFNYASGQRVPLTCHMVSTGMYVYVPVSIGVNDIIVWQTVMKPVPYRRKLCIESNVP